MLHKPGILFLDEPTIGLDLGIKDAIRALVAEINREFKTTVILTSHDVGDIENLCQRIIMINDGALMYDHSIRDFKAIVGGSRLLRVQVEDAGNTALDKLKAEGLEGAELSTPDSESNWVEARFNENQISLVAMIDRIQRAATIKDLEVAEISIEDVIRKVYSEQRS
jgi:ABC-2 type transport system ATP-binding protein